MIIKETITLSKFGNRKLKYFKNLGYDIDQDTFEVKVSDLTIGSRILVDVECDFCNKICNITYREYCRNISISNKYACSMLCGAKKSEIKSLEKWGTKHSLKSDIIRDKINKTNLEKYGSKSPMSSKIVKEKSKRTLMKKYGVDHISKTEYFRKKFKVANDPNYSYYAENSISVFNCNKGHTFSISSDIYHHRKLSNINICTNCYPLNENVSIKELELLEFIKLNYSCEIISNYRDDIEIDIYLPELKLGFEFNGLYWHSEVYKDKNYHLEKTNWFKEKGIRIIHIWEDDWTFKKDILKSQILNLLSKSQNKIYARKCIIKEVNSKDARFFLDNNHIQGFVGSSIRIGLYNNNELVSLMCFDNREGRKKMEIGGWNLSRFCTVLNTNVIGGASKLLKYFISNYSPKRIVSYSDNSWSIGNLYETIGFYKVCDPKIDYKYLINGIKINKQKFKKSNLNTNLSESEYMKSINFYKIWDCGKTKFEKIIQY